MGYPFDIVMPAEDAAKVAPQQKEIEWDAVHAMLGQAFRGHKIRAPSLCRTCWRKMGKNMEDFSEFPRDVCAKVCRCRVHQEHSKHLETKFR